MCEWRIFRVLFKWRSHKDYPCNIWINLAQWFTRQFLWILFVKINIICILGKTTNLTQNHMVEFKYFRLCQIKIYKFCPFKVISIISNNRYRIYIQKEKNNTIQVRMQTDLAPPHTHTYTPSSIITFQAFASKKQVGDLLLYYVTLDVCCNISLLQR